MKNNMISDNEKKRLITRLNRIEGQLQGIRRMVEDKVYCIDIITQTQAAKSAISSFEDVLLEQHLNTCAITQVKKQRGEKMVEEIMRVYKLSKKK